jgi:hypothetical protein
MRMADWVGRSATIRERVETKGGVVFERGEAVRIAHHHRGRLVIESEGAAPRRTASKVPRWMLRLSPKEGAS